MTTYTVNPESRLSALSNLHLRQPIDLRRSTEESDDDSTHFYCSFVARPLTAPRTLLRTTRRGIFRLRAVESSFSAREYPAGPAKAQLSVSTVCLRVRVFNGAPIQWGPSFRIILCTSRCSQPHCGSRLLERIEVELEMRCHDVDLDVDLAVLDLDLSLAEAHQASAKPPYPRKWRRGPGERCFYPVF